jgi:predicted transcriptional regulator
VAKKRPSFLPFGELEAAVMDVVWQRSSVTAREVHDRMTGTRERAYTTIMTTMDRLHRKGLLIREKDGLAWRYAAAMSRQEYEQGLANEVAAKILLDHGDLALHAFVEAAAELDGSLLEKLRRLIDRRGTR